MPKQNAVTAVCVELHALRSDVCDHHVVSELCSEAFTALRVMNGLPALLISVTSVRPCQVRRGVSRSLLCGDQIMFEQIHCVKNRFHHVERPLADWPRHIPV